MVTKRQEVGERTSITDEKITRAIMGLIKEFRNIINQEVPIQQLHILMLVADQPGVSQTEVRKLLNMPQGTVSRNCAKLGTKIERVKGLAIQTGYELIVMEPDPSNTRSLKIYLTPKGKEVVATVIGHCREILSSASG